MGTVFKREFKSLMSHVITYIFLAVTVAVFGFFLVFLNLANGNLQIEGGLIYSLWALILSVPFLCMFSYSQDRTNNRLKFLFSLPIKTSDIVLGKYLAYLCVFAIPVLIFSIIPPVLSNFGLVIYSSSYASILFYFLTGAAFIAACMFLNLQTKHELATLVFGGILLSILLICPLVADRLPKTPWVSLAAILVLELVVSVLAFAGSKRISVGCALLALTAVPTVVCFFIFKSSFSALFLHVSTFISPFARFEYFSNGIIRIEDIVYLLSVAALFLLFTQLTVNKTKNGDVKVTKLDSAQIKERYGKISRKANLTATISLVAVLLLNTLAVALPGGLTTIDASGCEKYSISKKSEALAENISQDITIYLLCENGIADASIETVIEKYASQNSKIHYKKIDVTANPEFTVDYIDMPYTYTSGGLRAINNNSVIIEGTNRNMVVDSSSFTHYRIGSSSYTSEEFLMYVDEYNKAYGEVLPLDAYKEFFSLDKILASSLEYVTMPVVGAVMTLEGHGEKPLSGDLYKNLGYSNVQCEVLNLSEADAVPQNCTTLIISSPETDISKEDADKIISFFEAGGEILLITSPENAGMENLLSIAENCGLGTEGGVLEENKTGAYLDDTDRTQLVIESKFGDMLFPNTHPIDKIKAMPDGVTVDEVLRTSTQANLVGETDRNIFRVAATVEKTRDDGNNAHLFWFSSYDAFTEQTVKASPANMLFLLYSVSYMGGDQTFTPSVVVDTRNVSKTASEIQPAQNYIFLGVFIAISLIALGMGISLHAGRRLRKK